MKKSKILFSIALMAVMLAGCTDNNVSTPAETTQTSLEKEVQVTEVKQEEPTYKSVPLSETYRIDGYDWYKGEKRSRNEMINDGTAYTKLTMSDMFIIQTQIGYLKDTTDELSPIDTYKDVGPDSGERFTYILRIMPNTELNAHMRSDGVIEFDSDELSDNTEDTTEYHTMDEYSNLYSIGYTIRVVDIYGNVVNTDWENQYGVKGINDEYGFGNYSLYYLDKVTENVPVENIDYVEYNFFGILNEDCTEGIPILDYSIKVRNPYCKD